MDRQWKALMKRAAALLLITGGLLAAVLLDTPCLFRKATGIPCPTCGMSRAWMSFLRLDLATALRYHPLFWCIPVLGIVYVLDGFPIPGKRLSRMLYAVILLLLALSYGIRLVRFLRGELLI